jgi:hypothetical protein
MQNRHRPSFLAALLARFTGKRTPAVKKAAVPSRPFQAIGVYHGTVCCSAAKKAEGSRFLARNAPPLPLTDCSMRTKCECRYIKFHDRRGSSRRLMEFGLRETLFDAAERRKKRGRRSKDF